MNQNSTSFIFILCFFFGVQHVLYAQDDIFQTPQKHTFIEANISINSARDFSELNPNLRPFLSDTVSYFLSSRDAIEIQFKYTKDIAKQISWYGGIYLGRSPIYETILFLDGPFTPGTTTIFPNTEAIDFQERSILYGSLIGGLKFSTRIFKNDRVYFGLGGKLTIYPKQDLSLNTTTFSRLRDEDFVHLSSSTLDDDTKFNGSLEIDISYHLIHKSEKYRLLVGILADRSANNIFNVTNDIALPTSTFSFEHSFSGIYLGAYLGFAYVLDSNTL